jgi:hypothetical protein
MPWAASLEPKGFVLTGSGMDRRSRLLETSKRSVFAIGDVCSGSTKRVAAAVGEGAQVVATLHAFLADADKRPAAVLKPGSAQCRKHARTKSPLTTWTSSSRGCKERGRADIDMKVRAGYRVVRISWPERRWREVAGRVGRNSVDGGSVELLVQRSDECA